MIEEKGTGRIGYDLLHGGWECAEGSVCAGSASGAGNEAGHAGLAGGDAAVAEGGECAGVGGIIWERWISAATFRATAATGRWRICAAAAGRSWFGADAGTVSVSAEVRCGNGQQSEDRGGDLWNTHWIVRD